MERTYFNLSVSFCSTRVHSRYLVGFVLLNHFCFQCTVLWILVIDCPFVVFICHCFVSFFNLRLLITRYLPSNCSLQHERKRTDTT